MAEVRQHRDRKTPRRRTWGLRLLSVALGAMSVGIGYGVTYLLSSGTVSSKGVGLGNLAAAAADPAATWQSVGWLFLGLHYVPVGLESSFGYARTAMVQAGPAWTPLVAAVPAAVLVVAATAAAVAGRARTLGDAVLRALWILPGYLVGVVALVFLSRWRFAGTGEWVSVTVDGVRAAVFAGCLAPGAAAFVGGTLGYAVLSTHRRFGSGGVSPA